MLKLLFVEIGTEYINSEFLISLLNSDNENVSGLGASIITHSCVTSVEQSAFCDARALKKLISLLEGSTSQKNASLESLAAVLKNNPGVILFCSFFSALLFT
ncbi:hypothetical protein DKX38_024766 [Salix brachista]|uniref:U-box domain-containing protein n=1 Tax=Salix brachista TaxID=2182728 RepID=A0A5N5K003_9ROSI|nr:hypothetical protein DKX38_024766 [Salix brachista]